MIFIDIPVRYRIKAGYHLSLKAGNSLNAKSDMALKVPLQKSTVRGLRQSNENIRSRVDRMVARIDIAKMEVVCWLDA